MLRCHLTWWKERVREGRWRRLCRNKGGVGEKRKYDVTGSDVDCGWRLLIWLRGVDSLFEGKAMLLHI